MGFLASSFARLKLVDWQHRTRTRFKMCTKSENGRINYNFPENVSLTYVVPQSTGSRIRGLCKLLYTYLPTVCRSSDAKSATRAHKRWEVLSETTNPPRVSRSHWKSVGSYLTETGNMAKRSSGTLKMVLMRNVNLVSPKIGMKQGRWMGTYCVAHSIRQSTYGEMGSNFCDRTMSFRRWDSEEFSQLLPGERGVPVWVVKFMNLFEN